MRAVLIRFARRRVGTAPRLTPDGTLTSASSSDRRAVHTDRRKIWRFDSCAPVSADDGKIEPSLLRDGIWRALGGVLTTNLYGLPIASRTFDRAATSSVSR